MDKLIEIKPQWQYDLEAKREVGTCPKCNGALVDSPVPCPDNKLGCLVLHYGRRCCNCGTSFR